jgi:hypothetical protein
MVDSCSQASKQTNRRAELVKHHQHTQIHKHAGRRGGKVHLELDELALDEPEHQAGLAGADITEKDLVNPTERVKKYIICQYCMAERNKVNPRSTQKKKRSI